MYDFLVKLQEKEYRVKARTRWEAIREAIKLFQAEVPSCDEKVVVLAAYASVFKLSRERRVTK